MRRLGVFIIPIFIGVVLWLLFLKPESAVGLQERFRSLYHPVTNLAAEKHDDNDKRSRQEILEELGRLREANGQLLIQSDFHDQLREENDQLRRDLDFIRRSKFALTAARVIKENRIGWWMSVTIDKGRDHGLVRNSAVITERGVVGKLVNVQEKTATVLLATDEQCQISARVEGSSGRGGITSGEGALMTSEGVRGTAKTRPGIILRHIERDARLEVGMKVYSSGLGRVFPQGRLIGTVTHTHRGDASQEALMEPAVDFSTLSTVFVVRAENNTEGTAKTESSEP